MAKFNDRFFERVVLATGHAFPSEDEATRSYFPQALVWSYRADIPPVRVGIMGTSLRLNDAAMAVASQHGRFQRCKHDLSFLPTTKGLHITLMSWTGVLPEADFYCPIPYEPLSKMTEGAVADCTNRAEPLDALFERPVQGPNSMM